MALPILTACYFTELALREEKTKFVYVDDYKIKNNMLIKKSKSCKYNNYNNEKHNIEYWIRKVKFIIGEKEEFRDVRVSTSYPGDIINNNISCSQKENSHVYYIGDNKKLYRYCLYFDPGLFRNNVIINKNAIDNIMKEHFKKGIIFEKNRSEEAFYRKLRNKGVCHVYIEYKYICSRKEINKTIFRIDGPLKRKEKFE